MGLVAAAHETLHPVRLLDADPDLGHGLTEEQLDVAERHAVLEVIALGEGSWELNWLRDSAGVRGDVHGFLVLNGDLIADTVIAGRTSTRLIGPGELVLLGNDDVSDSVPIAWSWTVFAAARLAILDDRLLVIARRCPRLLSAILKRAAQTTRHGLQQQAISQLPRVEERLLALLWTIADRRGVVRADGVWLELPATHQMLAQMIGAQRSTVTLGLRSLTRQGVLRAENGGWLLHSTSVGDLTSPADSSHGAVITAPQPACAAFS